jgi:hypothetical protein
MTLVELTLLILRKRPISCCFTTVSQTLGIMDARSHDRLRFGLLDSRSLQDY